MYCYTVKGCVPFFKWEEMMIEGRLKKCSVRLRRRPTEFIWHVIGTALVRR